MTMVIPAQQPKLSPLRQLLRYSQVDRAVSWTIGARVWQALSGPLTVLIIASAFSPAVQGYYYTFGSILALQSLLELGFFIVITNVASHEWSRLRIGAGGAIEGDAASLSRLRSLFRLIARWYAMLSLLFLVVVSFAGLRFFSLRPDAGVTWRAPWIAVVATQALLLWTMPFIALLEGCNQVDNVSRFRLWQTVSTSFALWAACLLHANLWTVVAVNCTYLANGLFFLGIGYRKFFRSLAQPAAEALVSWREELWPMQWRVAIGAASGYGFALFTPIIFHYHGAAAAGQMGMTLQAMTALHAIGLAWVQTRAPGYGILVAQREWKKLDQSWLRSSIAALCVVAAGAVSGWGLVLLLRRVRPSIGARFLSSPGVAALFATALLMLISSCLLTYLRAHKREPVVVWAVVTSVAAAAQMWIVGGRFGATAGSMGHLLVSAVAMMWLAAIWLRCRRKWHAAAAA